MAELTIGILGYQGSIEEHEYALGKMGVATRRVKEPKDLQGLDGIILPGGESTTMGKLLNRFALLEPLAQAIRDGLPVWGTCAGMILLAKEVEGDKPAEQMPYLQVMDIRVRRNGYGAQLDSFATNFVLPAIDPDPVPLVFIRAPYITEVLADEVQVLAEINGRIVAARERNMFVTAFHPELTTDTKVYDYFLDIINGVK